MRRLAAKLRATPMAIYYYVSSKDDLIAQISDYVIAQVPRPAPTGRNWKSELKAYALDSFERLAKYPGLSGEIVKMPSSAQGDQLAQYGVSILMAAGFDPRNMGFVITSYHALLFGVMSTAARFSGHGKRDKSSPRKQRRSESEAYLERLDFRALMEFAIDVHINGLQVELERQRTAKRSSKPARTRVRSSRNPESRDQRA
jgi:AcrR family transcriptional regulator